MLDPCYIKFLIEMVKKNSMFALNCQSEYELSLPLPSAIYINRYDYPCRRYFQCTVFIVPICTSCVHNDVEQLATNCCFTLKRHVS